MSEHGVYPHPFMSNRDGNKPGGWDTPPYIHSITPDFIFMRLADEYGPEERHIP